MGFFFFVIGVLVGIALLVLLPVFIAVLGAALAIGLVIALPLICGGSDPDRYRRLGTGAGIRTCDRSRADRLVVERSQAATDELEGQARPPAVI